MKRNAKSLLMVYTGHGKGKSTAAFGAVFRALGWGHKAAVVQFIKGKRLTGEQAFADIIDGVDFHITGRGFTWESEDISRDAAAARNGWQKADDYIQSGNYDLIVLDELTYTVHHGFLDLETILASLRARPRHTSIIVTGRDAPAPLIAIADLVTEMSLVKHPFQTSNKTFRALKGVDF